VCHGILNALANDYKKVTLSWKCRKIRVKCVPLPRTKISNSKIKLVSSVIFMAEDLFFLCLILTVPKNSPIMQEDG